MLKQIHLLILLVLCTLLVSCNNVLVAEETQIYETNQLLSQTSGPYVERLTVAPSKVDPVQTETPSPEMLRDSSAPSHTSTEVIFQETTEVIPANRYRLYRFSAWVSYWSVIWPIESFPDDRKFISDFTSDSNELIPGNAELFNFAHFADRISYWVLESTAGHLTGHLMIADMAYTSSKQVYSDEEHPYGDVLGGKLHLAWTPDDQHIIIDASGFDQQSYIYHVESDVIEPWAYNCDSIALSPKSGSYAVWCRSFQENDDFAVIEWGGEIWFSENPPNEYLIESNERVESPWAWSADGKHIAFFNENSNEANLTIVAKEGHQITVLPFSAYWLSEKYIETYSDYVYAFHPIKWSENGQYLLFYGKGGEHNPCPLGEKGIIEDVQIVEQACWQVINSVTGELVWPTQDKPYEAFLNLPEMVKTTFLGDAVITPDGAFIAIEHWYDSQNNLLVIDLQQGVAQNITTIESKIMRWGK